MQRDLAALRSLRALASLLATAACFAGCAEATLSDHPLGSDASVNPLMPGTGAGAGTNGGRVIVDPFAGSCAHSSIRAQSLPLDIVIMLDTSGSMNEKTSSGPTKWEAVTGAFSSFFRGSGAGIGAGLQFFPLVQSSVPAECSTDAPCGAFGPCLLAQACSGINQLIECAGNGDCPSGSSCLPLGQCTNGGTLCQPVGLSCGGIAGTCEKIPGRCAARDQCSQAAYRELAVGIGALPAGAPALLAAMSKRDPDGSTPTGPALQGALATAQAHALANLNRRAAVILATDGFPTSCEPRSVGSVAALAAAALAGSPSVPTFVIGVFSPSQEDAARANLNAIAQAGGSDQAFIVNTGTNVGQTFLAALNDVRAAALACEYQLPPDMFGQLDYGQVNVRFTSSRNTVATVGFVPNAAACDAQKGGWYFDHDPSTGVTPTMIATCPASCAMLRADPRGRVDLIFGCKTITVE